MFTPSDLEYGFTNMAFVLGFFKTAPPSTKVNPGPAHPVSAITKQNKTKLNILRRITSLLCLRELFVFVY